MRVIAPGVRSFLTCFLVGSFIATGTGAMTIPLGTRQTKYIIFSLGFLSHPGARVLIMGVCDNSHDKGVVRSYVGLSFALGGASTTGPQQANYHATWI